ncbi:hypothetical protein BS78_K315700 [Paspalum vaginatum]|uniref:TF-B3 domain-containing protein n=1 Tax=Paspalum vaginatum TaxID=158149 RepID=A0A9W8CEJ6_9POAL|nr:hypothetical protein BS78_K315700 [Paspalum vaginatum]
MPAPERRSPWATGERRPHFFKVLMGDFKKRLKIPPDFCKHIPWEASRKASSRTLKEASMAATLEGPSGRTWLVVIRRSAEGTFFASGWPKFVRDQALRELEFLVFRYDGGTRFTAMVFDTTACEREDLLAMPGGADPAPRGRQSKKRGRAGAVTGPSRDDANAKRANKKDSVGKELVPYRDREPGDRQQQAACSHFTPESGTAAAGGVKAEIEDADAELALTARRRRRVPVRRDPQQPLQDGAEERHGVKTRSIHEDLQALADIPASVRRYKGYVSRRRPVTGAERQRAMELAYATMHVYYSFMMRFPTGFSRQHLPRERTDVVLRDPGGKAWVVLYIPNTRDRLSRGWCAFARGNCLEEGDYCVFELVGAAEFRVHVFRVVDPPVPAVRLLRSA